MANDYGFYGSGLEGYVHYTQAVEESRKGPSGGGGGGNRGGCGNIGCGTIIFIAIVLFLLYCTYFAR